MSVTIDRYQHGRDSYVGGRMTTIYRYQYWYRSLHPDWRQFLNKLPDEHVSSRQLGCDEAEHEGNSRLSYLAGHNELAMVRETVETSRDWAVR